MRLCFRWPLAGGCGFSRTQAERGRNPRTAGGSEGGAVSCPHYVFWMGFYFRSHCLPSPPFVIFGRILFFFNIKSVGGEVVSEHIIIFMSARYLNNGRYWD